VYYKNVFGHRANYEAESAVVFASLSGNVIPQKGLILSDDPPQSTHYDHGIVLDVGRL
jgi:hypothetical protein